MGWGGVIGGIAGIVGGNQQERGYEAQADAARQGMEFQRGVYRDAQGNLNPYMQYGQGAGGLGGLSALMGGSLEGFWNSPDNVAQRKAMQYAGDHGAGARGNLFSGGHQVDMAGKQGDLAAQQLGTYRNALQWGAGLGQQSAMGLGQLGQSAAGNMMQGFQQMGNAQASAYGSRANTIGQLGSAFGDWWNGRNG